MADAFRPRLLPDEPLPPYSYVTGRFAHPLSDPAGHSFGHTAERPAPIDAANWRQSRAYLRAIDLFNHGFYWEAHEAWEGLWHAAGQRGTTADFLKGLIKLAAAGVKAREQRPAGVIRHARRAAALFEFVAQRTLTPNKSYLGFNLHELTSFATALAEHPPSVTEIQPVQIVFDFVLLPPP